MQPARGAVSCLAALLAAAGCIVAQTHTGSISGSVSDATGARVVGATVQVTNIQTLETRSALTNEGGDYLFPSVPAGEYTLAAQSSGFKREQRSGIRLDVNQNVRVDFGLQVGQLTEVVNVKSDAPLVDTRDVQLGGTVERQFVQDLPLDGRNVYDLAATMPGVTNVSTMVTGNYGGNYMNVNGNRTYENNFYLDGGSNLSPWRTGGNMVGRFRAGFHGLGTNRGH